MRNGRKEDHVKYSRVVQLRLTEQMAELVEAKALERHTTESEVIRQSIMSYMNRSMSDAEIVHASLVENGRKIRYLENKVELLALIVFQQVKLLMRLMPSRQVNSDALVEKDFERFQRECMKAMKSNHGGMLEAMVLDAYEQGDISENEDKG